MFCRATRREANSVELLGFPLEAAVEPVVQAYVG